MFDAGDQTLKSDPAEEDRPLKPALWRGWRRR